MNSNSGVGFVVAVVVFCSAVFALSVVFALALAAMTGLLGCLG